MGEHLYNIRFHLSFLRQRKKSVALIRRLSNKWHSWHLNPCFKKTCFSILLMFPPLREITILQTIQLSFTTVFLREMKQRFGPFPPVCHDFFFWQVSSSVDTRVWHHCFTTRNCQKNMPVSIKGIDKLGGIRFRWFGEVGTSSQQEPDSYPYTHLTPPENGHFKAKS